MALDIAFRTCERISPALQAGIIEFSEQHFSRYSWCQLTKPSLENENGFLQSDTRVSVSPNANDIDDARSEGRPDARLTDLLDTLCVISRMYDIEWEVGHDYGELGFIKAGRPDDELVQFCEGFNEMFDGTSEDIDPD
jgi:hypothetical protein